MDGTFTIKSRYAGPPEVARAFELATADVYLAADASPVLSFEVRDDAGAVIGRFEGFVSLYGDTTPEQFAAAVRKGV